ncbi:MAG: ribonuclease III [Lentimicrobiaceae bacterium]|jgi:ribonuclease-3|nr:ribonuclease III [Lentimicrobiaceae bacterium]
MPGNIFLYQLAFRHKSASNQTIKEFKVSNERLEYLGDAILSAVVADYLFKKFPTKNEGFLTEMRARIVSRASLNKLSQKLGFEQLLQYSFDHRMRYKSLGGDAFEAFIGALYLDKGYARSYKIIINQIFKLHINLESLEHTEFNFKSRLLEWSQKEKKHVDFNVTESGESHNRLYEVQVRIENKDYGKASDFSIKGATQLASEKTWHILFGDPEVSDDSK